MTEESLSNNECLAKVRAQVMTRDDSSGGWVPVAGGGMSLVGLRRISVFAPENQPSPLALPTSRVQFVITGHRLSDESVCLNCILKKDLLYNQVTPTFRHWTLRGKKFGLTFQSAADGKTFDIAVEKALEELKTCDPEASPELLRAFESGREDAGDQSVSGSESELARKLPLRPPRALGSKSFLEHRTASPQLSTTSVPISARHFRHSPVNEPAKRILSLPATMTKSLSAPFHSSSGLHHDPAYTVRLSASHTAETSAKELSKPLVSASEKYTYVDVISAKSEDEHTSVSSLYPDPPSSTHEYTYPASIDTTKTRNNKRDSISSIKIYNLDMMCSHRPPLLPIKNKRGLGGRKKEKASKRYATRGERSRCKYCHEYYSVEGNEKGACEFAPDKAKECINRLTCVPLASGLLSCGCGGNEGSDGEEYSPHPCSCDTSAKNCFWRWLALTAMSLLLPCLWCYYPLKGCHKMGLLCGACGGKHAPMDQVHR
ncbi:hypothetical protein RvY_17872 [Ramazzottius varieornatus]|uniref:WH1 domain-containing protein n=1 Tax=Ramazzottius varieornatus TaxID=947166 RepID=A0A1D1W9F2_RAMVA|nr:hypothetical protein RvY_17872 [Ramazzottius varieornatus]